MMAQERTNSTFVSETNDPAKADPDSSSSDEATVLHPVDLKTSKKQTTKRTITATEEESRRIRRKTAADAQEDQRLTTLAKRAQTLLSERRELHKANAQLQTEAEGLMKQLMFVMASDPRRHAVLSPEFDVVDAKRTSPLSSSSEFLMM